MKDLWKVKKEKICDAIFLHVLKKPGLFSNERFLVMTSASSRSLISSKKSSDFPASKSGDGYTQYSDSFYSMGYLWNMLTALQTRLRTFVVFASKVWTFICFIFRRQTRSLIQHKAIKYNVYPLSPLSKHRLSIVRRKTLVLDLDETLIHSFHDGVLRPTVRPGTPPDFILKVTIDRHPVRFFVHKRPHVDFFLQIVSQWYELVVFTASMEIYGTAVADKLDNDRGLLRRRYYRQHCTLDFGSYTKDLSAICADLSSVFILDNSPGAYRSYPDNAIPIKSWFNDPTDTALLNLLPVLDALRFVSDVRSVLSRNREAHRLWNR